MAQSVYHRFSAQSVERLAALSDGIFAVAMTLLVLDLKVPVATFEHHQEPLWIAGAFSAEADWWRLIGGLLTRFLPYCVSFLTLGIFWIAQQTELNFCARGDRVFTWLNLAFLFSVSLLPFSTSLLAEFIAYRSALGIYWLNLLMLGATLFSGWRYAQRKKLLKEEVSAELGRAIERRIVVFQILYFGSFVLSAVNTYLGIVLMLSCQVGSLVTGRNIFRKTPEAVAAELQSDRL